MSNMINPGSNKIKSANKLNKTNGPNKTFQPQLANKTQPPGGFGANFNSANKSKGIQA